MTSPIVRLAALALALPHLACSSNPAPAGADAGPYDAGTLVNARPYQTHIPASYHPGTPAPLLVMLHGYSATGALEELYLQLANLSDEQGFLYAYPDGTVDQAGQHFWNATDACCNFNGSTVDDVAYLGAVIDDMEARYTVDSKRIYLFGHSNGAFMANRLGCDLSPRIAAFVSLAGDTWKDQSRCRTTSPVSMIEFQGTLDSVVDYAGGMVTPTAGGVFPGAAETAADWAALDGCTGAIADGGVEAVVSGLTTTVARYSGCSGGAGVELWTIEGGSHIPALASGWAEPFWSFLSAHPKQ